MSFGFSVGDFIAVGKLVNDIVKCLQSVGGAKSEYQEMVREFEILTKALVHIDHLKAADQAMTAQLNHIKFAALSCRYPLQAFRTKMEEYDSSLGIKARTDMMRKAARKVRWSLGPSDDIKQLRMYLNTHVGTINMLLAQYGLEQMTSASAKSEENFMQVSRKLDTNQALLMDVKSDTSSLGHGLSNVQSILRGDVGTSLGQLLIAMGQNRISTEQVHTSLAEIMRSLRDLDTGMTYLQRPFHVEDALGFTYAIPSELGYGMLDAYIRCRFEEGASSQDVALGNYEFSRADQRSSTITACSQLTPGTRIVMAVIIKANVEKPCPMPGCASIKAHPYAGGGFTCDHCGVWFDQSTKRRHELGDRAKEVHDLIMPMDKSSIDGPKESPGRGVNTDRPLLRNVKIAPAGQSPRRESIEGQSSGRKKLKEAFKKSQLYKPNWRLQSHSLSSPSHGTTITQRRPRNDEPTTPLVFHKTHTGVHIRRKR